MKLTELVTTPKGRKATAKLAWDLSKIAGGVAVAGTVGFIGAIAKSAADSGPSNTADIYPDTTPDGYGYGPTGYGYYSGGVMVDDD
ncbi:hypothetical protein [Halomonas dongshanensis]|uniref:Uncharacterized protein n=1 Tax=Halomonas dongshanensis TaxID=2890835 RepID=A0ABT2EHE9_9GAMM|nr:hypothetical protein [Halomonas dongshanensis]MCS2611026.1 hypothetical protein [Halomonas dongshanensis]